MTRLAVRRERWPIRGAFTISRGSKKEALVVVVELAADGCRGRGECVPYARYGETVDTVIAEIEALRARIEAGLSREELHQALPPGAARNALDCALWDLEAKKKGAPAWRLAGLETPQPLTTAYTLSLAAPESMAQAARANAHRPVLKLKLGGEDDLERVAAVKRGAPSATLIVDANEGWTLDDYQRLAPRLAELGVALIEQPLPADRDAGLARVARPVPVCADESCHDTATLDRLAGKYDFVNVKLDKTGGLTEALRVRAAAEARGLGVMLGCMVCTSLGVAPAILAAQGARFVDLDAPLLLERDREPGLRFEGSTLFPPDPALWG